MAGLYIHIPFCMKRCRYCDFFSTTRLEERSRYMDALMAEYQTRRWEYKEDFHTIYLGGGTPSLLSEEDLHRLFLVLPTHQAQEITIEANPGDITKAKIDAWRSMGINRLSIGVQSLHDDLLRTLGRRHTAQQALQAVRTAQSVGLNNISVDLMYGLPGQNIAMLEEDLMQLISMGIPHISTYCLSYEDNTPMGQQLRRGEITETPEEEENAMYDTIVTHLTDAGWKHYEISNFALPGMESKHNGNYWNHTPYCGLGAGAHSFDGHRTRRRNENDLDSYITGARNGHIPFEEEVLSDEQIRIERIMLGLRTAQGIEKELADESKIQSYIQCGLLTQNNNHYVATLQGQHILNCIIEDLI